VTQIVDRLVTSLTQNGNTAHRLETIVYNITVDDKQARVSRENSVS